MKNDLKKYSNMSEFELTNLVSGALFGAALMSAGVYSPHVIIGQMKLENFHMLKAFLAASASSAYVCPEVTNTMIFFFQSCR